jgi:hypothetical protein
MYRLWNRKISINQLMRGVTNKAILDIQNRVSNMRIVSVYSAMQWSLKEAPAPPPRPVHKELCHTLRHALISCWRGARWSRKNLENQLFNETKTKILRRHHHGTSWHLFPWKYYFIYVLECIRENLNNNHNTITHLCNVRAYNTYSILCTQDNIIRITFRQSRTPGSRMIYDEIA